MAAYCHITGRFYQSVPRPVPRPVQRPVQYFFDVYGNFVGGWRPQGRPGLTTMDFADSIGLPEPFLSIDDMLDFSNEDLDLAVSIGEEDGVISENIVSNLGSNMAGDFDSNKFSDIDLQRAVKMEAGGAQGMGKMKDDFSFDSHRPIISQDFLAIDPLCVASGAPDDDWFSGLLDGGISPEARTGYGEDIFRMQMQALNDSSGTCNESSITSDQNSLENHQKSINSRTQSRPIPCGDEHSYGDAFLSSSPVSVLESTSGSSKHHHHLQNQHNQFYKEQSIPGRARSKRLRTGGRVWSNARILSDSSSYSSTDAEAFSSDSSLMSDHHGGVPAGTARDDLKMKDERDSYHNSTTYSGMQDLSDIMHMMTPPPKAVTTAKKPWKPKSASGGTSGSKDGATASAEGSNQQQPWRCLHCGSQRTPQWRAGPQGPKTLCNACGVRFKSGRLVPEYRPAGSPSFDSSRHSNCHKKIMERRRHVNPLPPSLKTSSSYSLGPGLPTGVDYQSLGPFASANPFSSSPVRALDGDRTSCS